LEAVMLDEGALQSMHSGRISNSLYRRDCSAPILHRESEARDYALAFDQHSACAACAMVTALLGTGKVR
jgi:hypothetical protein